MSDEPKKDLKQLHADNDKRAAAESAMIKADIRNGGMIDMAHDIGAITPSTAERCAHHGVGRAQDV